MKKMIIVLIMFLLIFTSTGFCNIAFAADFSDVPSDHWAKEAIDYGVQNAYIKGMGNGLFEPNSTTTRAQVCTMLVSAFGFKLGPNMMEGFVNTEIVIKVFSDVHASDWFKNYVDIASSLGIVNGYPDGTFLPDKQITREEISSLIANSLNCYSTQKYGDYWLQGQLGIMLDSLEPFSDYRQILDSWGSIEVGIMVYYKIFNGYPDNNIHIDYPTTRAEAAVIIFRTLQLKPKIDQDFTK